MISDEKQQVIEEANMLNNNLNLMHAQANALNSNQLQLRTPSLVILEQGSVLKELLLKNGIQKQVHVVVKNLPFTIELMAASNNNTLVDLSKCRLEAKLLYDLEKEDENTKPIEVSFVKNEPLDYKVNISDATGEKASVELRIKVLTSQHEDMLFRVRISAIDPLTNLPFEVLSQPIKVISKLTQLKKAPPGSSPAVKGGKRGSVGLSSPQSGLNNNNNSLANDGNINNAIMRIEHQLQEQNKLLQLIIQRLYSDTSNFQQPVPESLQTLSNIISQTLTASNDMSADDYSGGANSNQGAVDNNNTSTEVTQSGLIPLQPLRSSSAGRDEFDAVASKFVSALNDLPQEEKLTKMQKFLETVPAQTADRLKEFVDLLEQQTQYPIRNSANKRPKTENDQ